MFSPSGAVNPRSVCVVTPSTGSTVKSREFVKCLGRSSLRLTSKEFFTGTLVSCGKRVVKSSTKKPDLNLFKPSESAINKLSVLTSNKDKVV